MTVTAMSAVRAGGRDAGPRSALPGFGAMAPGLVVIVGAAACLVATGTPFGATVAYLLYAVAAVLVPGTLVARTLLGHGESLLVDLAWGVVVGFALELLGWALFTMLGVNHLLLAWPAAIVAAFVVVPGLRGTWRRPAGSGRTPPVAAWGVAVASVAAFVHLSATFYRINPPPPSGVSYSVDLPWHLGVAYEAQRTVLLQPPEALAEGPLHYHWFSDAHFAAASLISRVDLPMVITRPGLFLLVFAMVIGTAALALKVSDRGLAAGLAAVLVVATSAGATFWAVGHSVRLLYPDSPSGIYAAPTSCLIAALLIDLVRRGRLRIGQWCVFVGCLALAIGSKPSVLIVLLPAAGLLGLWSWWRARRPDLVLVVAGLAMAGAIAVSIPLFSSAGGSAFDPNVDTALVTLRSPLWALVLVALAKAYWMLVPTLFALTHPKLRSNPAAILLAGAALVGFVEAWTISHPGLSQRFFWSTAMPFASVMCAWGVAVSWPRVVNASRRLAAFSLVATVTLMVGLVVPVAPLAYSIRRGTVAAAVVLAVSVVAFVCLRPPLRAALATLAVLPMVLSIPAALAVQAIRNPPVVEHAARGAGVEAALWIHDHTPEDAVLATNAHCSSPTDPKGYCDARSFVFSGFGGRRVVIEGYGVSPAQLALSGRNGYRAWWQPYHDEELYALNERAVADQDPDAIGELRDRYGVGWLVLDTRRSPAPSLRADSSDAPVEVYRNDPFIVYRLSPTPAAGPAD